VRVLLKQIFVRILVILGGLPAPGGGAAIDDTYQKAFVNFAHIIVALI